MTVSKAQKKATSKWEKKKYDKILIRLPKGTKEQLKEKADQGKMSLNKYIENILLQQLNNKIPWLTKTANGSWLVNFSAGKKDTEK